MHTANLRNLTSVDRLVAQFEQEDGAGRYPHRLLVDCARAVVDQARSRLLQAESVDITLHTLLADLRTLVQTRAALTLTRAVNATGIILHTNLGRSPLCDAAMQAVAEVMAGYSTLEIDLDTGRRGSRHQHVEPLLIRITGAEAAFVVNNNAAAVLLALTAVARGKQVIVSRGELVEIGGSFRMPEVMAQSGAVLMEVGATNRTHLRDYERAIGADTGLLLKVHRSNFSMTGFVAEVSVADLVELGRRHGIPVMFDLGSGCLVNLRTHGLAYEPTVQDAMTAGCELVTFSGDKLLGGPQAGLIVGRTTFVERIRSHPLARAVRMDKLDYSALAATLQQYVDPEAPGTPCRYYACSASRWTTCISVLYACGTLSPRQCPPRGKSPPRLRSPKSAADRFPKRICLRMPWPSNPLGHRRGSSKLCASPGRRSLPESRKTLFWLMCGRSCRETTRSCSMGSER